MEFNAPLPPREYVSSFERLALVPPLPLRVVLGLLTFWPIAYMFVFFIAILGSGFFAPSADPKQSFDFFKYIFPLHFLTIFLIFGP